ncbi:MAG TPA: hypothetical protein ENF44_03570 [Deltaproteobacteria bacterium]|nr:hypothetical protein [Deltaproteobacteria bacterium]
MTFPVFYVENILHTYQKQLRTEPKPARVVEERRPRWGEVRDRVSISEEARRKQILSRIASEVVEEVTR